MKLTGAQIVLEVIKENNIDTVFGYPGGAILPIYDELLTGSYNIRHIRSAHEQGAAHAADAYARVGGKTGVVFATSGPGATNLVTALATAQADSSPLVAITGNTQTDMVGRDSFQEVYIAGITMSVTKHNFVVREKKQLLPMLRRAFEIAHEGRCGAVLVDIPKNILTSEITYTAPRPKSYTPPRARKSDIAKLTKLINNSVRPLIYYGGGIIASDAHAELHSLCTVAAIPACHTLMGIGALDTGCPYNIGLAGMHGRKSVAKAIDECDLLIAIGTRFSDRVAFSGKDFAHEAKRVHIDIDDAEISKNITISLGIQADAKQVLSQLCESVEKKVRQPWLDRLVALHASLDEDYSLSKRLTPMNIISTLAANASDDAIIVTDVGQHQIWTAQLYPFIRPKTFISPGGLGTMGFGLGGAIGAWMAQSDKQVYLITSDGSFHMNMCELSTAVRCNANVKVIVMDNASLGMVRQWQNLFYDGRYTETDETSATDFVMIAKAFGAHGFHADTCAEFESSIKTAIACDGPCVIHCKIDKELQVSPLISEGGDHIIMR